MNVITTNFITFSFVIGKNSTEKTYQYARFMRHKCLKFCPLFHTAVLLFERFKVTDELQRLDFTNNKNWYKHKLIANINCCKDFKYIKDKMGGRFYEDKIK